MNLSEICSFHYVKRSTHYNQDKRMWIRQIDHHFKCINQLATLVTSQNRTARHLFCLSCVLEPLPGGHGISAPPSVVCGETVTTHWRSPLLLRRGPSRHSYGPLFIYIYFLITCYVPCIVWGAGSGTSKLPSAFPYLSRRQRCKQQWQKHAIGSKSVSARGAIGCRTNLETVVVVG